MIYTASTFLLSQSNPPCPNLECFYDLGPLFLEMSGTLETGNKSEWKYKMYVDAQWILPSLVLQQGQVLQTQSCPHFHGRLLFLTSSGPAKFQGGRHWCAMESAAFELRREAALSKHVSPLSRRLAMSCMAGEIKWQSESCCCLGLRTLTQARMCGAGGANAGLELAVHSPILAGPQHSGQITEHLPVSVFSSMKCNSFLAALLCKTNEICM